MARAPPEYLIGSWLSRVWTGVPKSGFGCPESGQTLCLSLCYWTEPRLGSQEYGQILYFGGIWTKSGQTLDKSWTKFALGCPESELGVNHPSEGSTDKVVRLGQKTISHSKNCFLKIRYKADVYTSSPTSHFHRN